MKNLVVTHTIIKKIVNNSQRIEGYEPASREIKQKAKELMKKYNVKVSA
jgi:hypothetical protein